MRPGRGLQGLRKGQLCGSCQVQDAIAGGVKQQVHRCTLLQAQHSQLERAQCLLPVVKIFLSNLFSYYCLQLTENHDCRNPSFTNIFKWCNNQFSKTPAILTCPAKWPPCVDMEKEDTRWQDTNRKYGGWISGILTTGMLIMPLYRSPPPCVI